MVSIVKQLQSVLVGKFDKVGLITLSTMIVIEILHNPPHCYPMMIESSYNHLQSLHLLGLPYIAASFPAIQQWQKPEYPVHLNLPCDVYLNASFTVPFITSRQHLVHKNSCK